MFLGFFILKFLKSEMLLALLAEAKLVVLSATLPLKLHNQFGLRASEKPFTNRTVPLLFKCNLLLLGHEPSILLLLINLIPLPLHRFSNFLLIVYPQGWKPPQTESHLEFRQTSTTELLCKNSQGA